MEIYTLASNFTREAPIDGYKSLVWTERYSSSGDFVLTVAATPAASALLVEGKFLSCNTSNEVGIIETVENENGILTIKGPFLTYFLSHRIIRSSRTYTVQAYNVTGFPGVIATEIVKQMCVTGGTGVAGATPPLLYGSNEVITNLTIGASDGSGTSVTLPISFGDIYTEVKKICDEYSLGFRLYLESASTSTYSLKFESYKGRDLTRAQSTYPVVAFSSILDSLANVKEFRSIAGYRNVCFAYSTNIDIVTVGGAANTCGYATAGTGHTDTNFARRTMMVLDSSITASSVGSSSTELKAQLDKIAKDALINNNYVRMLDGQIVPQNPYKYGSDYKLGDIIELNAASGLAQKARITEYIYSRDENGERSYPTLSVV